MAVLPYDRSPSRLPVWLGAGGITVFVVLGIVAMGLPLRCDLGLSWDNSCPAGTPGASAMRSGAVAGPPSVAVPGASAVAAPKVAPAIGAKPQNLVAATFGRLGSAATQPEAIAAPVGPSAPAAGASAGELATRVVKTLAVGPDGAVGTTQPAVAAPAAEPVRLAVATAAPPTIDPAPAVQTSSSSSALPTTAAVPADVVPAPLPPRAAPRVLPSPMAQGPSAGGSVRIVGGAGVTVRSVPGKNGARLFALSAGEHVTVSGTQRGWLHVTNARGQTGWAYSSFFDGGRN